MPQDICSLIEDIAFQHKCSWEEARRILGRQRQAMQDKREKQKLMHEHRVQQARLVADRIAP